MRGRLLILLIISSITSYAQSFSFLSEVAASDNHFTRVDPIVSKHGYVYVALTAGANTYVNSAQVTNTYNLLKYDQSGNLIWIKPITTGTHPIALEIGRDSSIWIGGTNYDFSILYIEKYDKEMNLLWSYTYGTGQQHAGDNDHWIRKIKEDQNGDLIIAGTSITPGDLGCGTSSNTVSNSGFIGKISSTGSCIWSKRTGKYAPLFDFDQNNNIVLANGYPSAAMIDSTNPQTGSGVIACLNTNGDLQWSKSFSGGTLTNIKCLSNGRILVGGYYLNPIGYDNLEFPVTAQYNAFIASLNSDHVFDKQFFMEADTMCYGSMSVSLEESGNGEIYMTGIYSGKVSVQGDGLPETFNYSNGFMFKLGQNLEVQSKLILPRSQNTLLTSDEQSFYLVSELYDTTNIVGPFSVSGNAYKIFMSGFGNSLPTTVVEVVSSNALVYPNPAKDHIYLIGDDAQDLDLYDLSGKLLRQLKHTGNSAFDLNGINKGCYFLRASNSGKIHKVVVE
jgi:hypothetical protein